MLELNIGYVVSYIIDKSQGLFYFLYFNSPFLGLLRNQVYPPTPIYLA